ncbi:hypothetical protein [Corallincola holothuriorum]|uniref:hypothetical protein n=1 Tax=Corallincola holothuriorum TaxID=2282215 RepID=UPI0011C05036|nr:hypothetical protein [Corallincola holothuriorum]
MTKFDKLVLFGFFLISLSLLGWSVLIHGNSAQAVAASIGIWLLLTFFVMTLLHGVISGVPRTKVAIPALPTTVVICVSGALFIYAVL